MQARSTHPRKCHKSRKTPSRCPTIGLRLQGDFDKHDTVVTQEVRSRTARTLQLAALDTTLEDFGPLQKTERILPRLIASPAQASTSHG